MVFHAGNDVVDIVHGEHDPADAQRVRRRLFRLSADRRRRVEFRELKPAMTVWSPHHRDLDPDVVEPDHTVHRLPLDWHLTLELQTKFDKERDSSVKVLK